MVPVGKLWSLPTDIGEVERSQFEYIKVAPVFIVAGRMDHAHHHNNAIRALDEVISLEESVKIAKELTSSHDTLIIVTADHSHTLAFGGYPKRGNPILGKFYKEKNVPKTGF